MNWRNTLLVVLSFPLLGAKCASQPPVIEHCIVGTAGCLCYDARLPEPRRQYLRPFPDCVNFIATNPQDYNQMEEWMGRNCRGEK